MTEPLDKLGQSIAVGSYLVYGHAMGRSAGLRIGRVLAVKRNEPVAWGSEHDRAGAWRIRVQGVDDDWTHRAPELCRPGTLQFPERTIVVQPEQVPAAIRALLEST